MFRSKPHFSFSSPEIYYLLSLFPPAWSRGEVSSTPRTRSKGQEGRVGGKGQALQMAPAPLICVAKGLDHLKQMPEARDQPKPDSRPLPRSSPLSMAGSSGQQWEVVGNVPSDPAFVSQVCRNKVPHWVAPTTEMYCLTVLEAKSPKLRCEQGWCL